MTTRPPRTPPAARGYRRISFGQTTLSDVADLRRKVVGGADPTVVHVSIDREKDQIELTTGPIFGVGMPPLSDGPGELTGVSTTDLQRHRPRHARFSNCDSFAIGTAVATARLAELLRLPADGATSPSTRPGEETASA